MSNGSDRQDWAGASNALEIAIGSHLRAMRQSIGVTLADLAKAASISVGMLSKIENGQTSPSLATLQSLASSLNVPISAFFARFDEKHEATFVKAGQGKPIERRGSSKGHRYALLGHSLTGPIRVEPCLVTLDAGSEPYPIFQHPGAEFIYMVEGEMTYRNGDDAHVMTAGDSLFFNAEALHGVLEIGSLPVAFLVVQVSYAEA